MSKHTHLRLFSFGKTYLIQGDSKIHDSFCRFIIARFSSYQKFAKKLSSAHSSTEASFLLDAQFERRTAYDQSVVPHSGRILL